MKDGDDFTVKIGRKNSSNSIDTIALSQKVTAVTEADVNKLSLMENPTPKQLLVQKAWLTAKPDEAKVRPAADPNDVASIDAIIKATYDVISGPAGDRNWNRFLSLFLPEGRMGAIATDKNGKPMFHAFTPEKYIKSNAPFFKQSAFYEEELNRSVAQFGNVATVQSAYQFRLSKDGKIEQRGVNYFSLVKSGDRWYISDLNWQDEEKDLPLPEGLLKK